MNDKTKSVEVKSIENGYLVKYWLPVGDDEYGIEKSIYVESLPEAYEIISSVIL